MSRKEYSIFLAGSPALKKYTAVGVCYIMCAFLTKNVPMTGSGTLCQFLSIIYMMCGSNSKIGSLHHLRALSGNRLAIYLSDNK